MEAELPALTELRRHLHRHPELSHEEFETTRYIADRLAALGFEVHVRPEGTGLYADLTPSTFDPATQVTVAVRCDLDALAIAEETGTPYQSRHPGKMHACGHDVHMTCAYGAGLALAELATRASLPGRLRLVYQHAEETVGGAQEMIAFGALRDVDYVLALHVDPELPVGQIGVRAGAFTAAFDEFGVTVIGESGHGARPHHTVDPIFVLTQLCNALYNAVGRSADARDPMVLSIGVIEGGQAPNIIPERATIQGTIRTLSQAHRSLVEPLLVRIADGVCSTYGARYDLKLRRGAPAIINDLAVTEVIAEVGAELLGDGHVQRIPLPSMGSEDFSYFVEAVPGAMFRLGAWTAGEPRYFLHSARFAPDEGAIPIGATVLATTALRLMERRRSA